MLHAEPSLSSLYLGFMKSVHEKYRSGRKSKENKGKGMENKGKGIENDFGVKGHRLKELVSSFLVA